MIEEMSHFIVNKFLAKDEDLSKDQIDVMLFGVTRILEDIPKFLTIIFMCYLLDILKELFIVFVITICYKTFVGGAHAKTNIKCFIVSSIYFILPIIIAKYLEYNISVFYFIYIFTIAFSMYVIVKIAPADTEEIPIINSNKRLRLKFGACISLIAISIVVILFINQIVYMKIILYTILLINMFTTKLMYRMLDCKLGSQSEEFAKFYQI